MITHLISKFWVEITCKTNANPILSFFSLRMWDEIKDKAKLHLLRTLGSIKIHLAINDSSVSKHGDELWQYFFEQPASDVVQIWWRCIIDLYIEHEFI